MSAPRAHSLSEIHYLMAVLPCESCGKGPWNVNVGRMTFNNISLLGMWGGNIAHLDDIAGWMQEGRLDIKPMLQSMPLAQWREAFDMLRRQEGVKVVLEP